MGVNFDYMKMSCGLFSSFDPGSWEFSYMNKWMVAGWTVCMVCVTWQVFSMWSGLELVKGSLNEMIWSVVNQSSKSASESMLVVCTMFSLILFSNLSGLTPYSFTLTSHLSMNSSLAIPLWGMGVLVYMWKPLNSFISHFLPTGSPVVLWPFLVVIEVVSWLIRPITLSIRLMANIVAGHLVAGLVGGMISSTKASLVLLPILSGLMSYEIGVSVIQAYVFMNLIVLYCSESE